MLDRVSLEGTCALPHASPVLGTYRLRLHWKAQRCFITLGHLLMLPPCVCRDVKAENIVLEGGQAGGRVYLLDFGGVQAAAAAGDGNQSGSTIIGTYGYMAPEQFCRQATPASDLYGLGGTLLFILSGAGLSQSETHRHT